MGEAEGADRDGVVDFGGRIKGSKRRPIPPGGELCGKVRIHGLDSNRGKRKNSRTLRQGRKRKSFWRENVFKQKKPRKNKKSPQSRGKNE